MGTCSRVSLPQASQHAICLYLSGTGTQPTGVACKSIQTQLNELLDVISENKIIVQRLWFDIEPTSGTCNAWNLGASANLALAKQWVAALKGTGLKWGIYANGLVMSSISAS